jgi:hypothetical protein
MPYEPTGVAMYTAHVAHLQSTLIVTRVAACICLSLTNTVANIQAAQPLGAQAENEKRW